MSFASRFPTVARLLSMQAADDDQRDEDESQGGEDAGESAGDDDQDQDQGGDEDAGGEGDEGAAAASLSELGADDRSALQSAFTRDANAQVSAAQARCIEVFTSEPGTRAPNAAARLLRKTSMSAKDIIDTLKDTGATSRAVDRQRLRSSAESRPDTGQGEEPATAAEQTRKSAAERRKKRNAGVKKRGGVKANRTEFDAGDDE